MTITLAIGVQRDGGAPRDHPPPAGGRDAGLGDHDLLRQDRHAHRNEMTVQAVAHRRAALR